MRDKEIPWIFSKLKETRHRRQHVFHSELCPFAIKNIIGKIGETRVGSEEQIIMMCQCQYPDFDDCIDQVRKYVCRKYIPTSYSEVMKRYVCNILLTNSRKKIELY